MGVIDIEREPVFCITSDIDWASSFCISSMLKLFEGSGIVPTLFITHDRPVLKEFSWKYPDNVGIHPNFLETRGEYGYSSIISCLLESYPNAKFSRSHSYYDSTVVSRELRRKGIRYDSNFLLYLQVGIKPFYLRMSDMVRFPVFWDDSAHLYFPEFNWKFSNVREFFLTPGLKVVNVHPFLVTTNVSSEEQYQEIRKKTATFSDIDMVWEGEGPRSFLLELIDFVRSQGLPFHSFYDLCQSYQRGELSGY